MDLLTSGMMCVTFELVQEEMRSGKVEAVYGVTSFEEFAGKTNMDRTVVARGGCG